MLIEFNKITTLNDSNNYFTNKLPLRHSYVFKGQTSSYYISGLWPLYSDQENRVHAPTGN